MIKHLRPFKIYSFTLPSPSRTFCAKVLQDPASDPASGSVRANAAKPLRFWGQRGSLPGLSLVSMSTHHFFCSSVPARRTGLMPRLFVPQVSPNPASPYINSSRIHAAVTLLSPCPPYSAGRSAQISPISNALLYASQSSSPLISCSAAFGRTSFITKSWTISTISLSSPVNTNPAAATSTILLPSFPKVK